MQVLSITLSDKDRGFRETLRIERESVIDLHERIIADFKREMRFEAEDEAVECKTDEAHFARIIAATKAIANIGVNYLGTEIEEPVEGQSEATSSKKPTKHRIPKVKAINCHGCGDIIVGKFETGDLFECRNCNSTQTIEDIFDFGEYNCTCCGTSAYLGLTSESYEYVTCKQCQAPIDMVWHPKDKKYVSMNMIGH
jgi:hypothetical protein